MTEIDIYLEALKLKLVTSAVVSQYTIIKERTTTTDGYLRVQITLSNGDFLELTEYFVHRQRKIETVDYRYQWMDATKRQLKRRWDNTAHHPEIQNFPHHIHEGSEDHVVEGKILNTSQVLDVLEELINDVQRQAT